jgi:hypothetical protein
MGLLEPVRDKWWQAVDRKIKIKSEGDDAAGKASLLFRW